MSGGFYSRKQLEEIVSKILTDRPTRGRAYFVDQGNGSDSNPGDTLSNPLKNVATALAKCQDDHHDIIFVLPSSAYLTDTLELNVSGVHLIGLPYNPMNPEDVAMYLRPTAWGTGDAGGPVIKVTKPCEIAGLTLCADWVQAVGGYPGTSGADLEIDGEGGGFNGSFCHIHHCRFPGWVESTGIHIWGGSYNLIEKCVFENLAYAGIVMEGSTSNNPTYNTIRKNIFRGCDYGVATRAGMGTPQNNEVLDNEFIRTTANALVNAILTNSQWSNGLLAGNRVGLAEAAAFDLNRAGMEGLNVFAAGNWYTDGVDPRT